MTEREPKPVVTQAALKALQDDAGLQNLPTELTYELRMAVSGEGPRAYDWDDKPHRLLYAACAEIERLAHPSPSVVTRLREHLIAAVSVADALYEQSGWGSLTQSGRERLEAARAAITREDWQ